MRLYFLLAAFSMLLLSACKKTPEAPVKSSQKSITSFKFKAEDNPGNLNTDYTATISNDSILVKMPAAIAVNNLIATVQFSGVELFPDATVGHDYTTPITYTVTAEDGSTKNYKVIVQLLSAAKSITAFQFLKVDNAVLSEDVKGEISNDSIRLVVPGGTDVKNLVPAIQFNGKQIAPANKTAQDFTNEIMYTVTAEDNTQKTYRVIVSVAVNTIVYSGSTDNYFYAIDGTTGKLIWKFKTNGPIYSSPTVVDNVVYFGSNDQYMYALNATTGKIKWMCKLYSEAAASPVVVDGVLYTTGYIYAVQGYTYAIDINTGIFKWITVNPYPVSVSPTVAYGLVYIGDAGGGVKALSVKDGSEVWYYNLGITQGNACIKDGVLYWGGEKAKVLALNALTGELLWKVSGCCGTGSSAITFSNNVLYVGSPDGTAYAFDALTGAEIWRQKCGSVQLTSPSLENGIMYISDGSWLYALNASTGQFVWQQQVALTANLTLANNILYGGGGSTLGVFAYEANTGKYLWQFNNAGNTFGGPCVVDYKGNIYHTGLSGAKQ